MVDSGPWPLKPLSRGEEEKFTGSVDDDDKDVEDDEVYMRPAFPLGVVARCEEKDVAWPDEKNPASCWTVTDGEDEESLAAKGEPAVGLGVGSREEAMVLGTVVDAGVAKYAEADDDWCGKGG